MLKKAITSSTDETVAGIDNLVSTDSITGQITTDYTIIATNTYEIIPMILNNKTGNNLTINSSGQIVIGKGIKKILVDYSIRFSNITATGIKFATLHQNDAAKVQASAYLVTSERSIIPATRALLDVTEGDVIDVRVYGTAGEKVGGLGTLATYITIEAVGYTAIPIEEEMYNFTSECTFSESYAKALCIKKGNEVTIFYQGESKIHSSGETVFTIPSEYLPSSNYGSQFWENASLNGTNILVYVDHSTGNFIVNGSSSNNTRIYANLKYFID